VVTPVARTCDGVNSRRAGHAWPAPRTACTKARVGWTVILPTMDEIGASETLFEQKSSCDSAIDFHATESDARSSSRSSHSSAKCTAGGGCRWGHSHSPLMFVGSWPALTFGMPFSPRLKNQRTSISPRSAYARPAQTTGASLVSQNFGAQYSQDRPRRRESRAKNE
jgi:hypothetical protein